MITNRPIDKLFSTIKPLEVPHKPQYYIKANQSGCYYELFINGRLIFKHFENVGLLNHQVCINDAILKSGIQTVTVKLYPLGKIDDTNFETFTKNTEIEIEISEQDAENIDPTRKRNVVKKYKITNFDDSDSKTKPDGLPYLEETFTFKAKVPYEIKGWSESQILTDLDQKELEKEIVSFYNNFADVIYNQDEKKWMDLVGKRELEHLKSVGYNNIKDPLIRERIKEFKAIFDSDFKKKFPLDKYKMIFGGNGRMVTLKSIERSGKSAFSYGISIDYLGKMQNVRQSKYIYLHKPKGSAKLEIIR